MEKARETIAILIARNKRGIIDLLRDYGVYNSDPDVQTIMDMYIVYGEPFLMRVYDLHHHQQNSFLGFGKKKVAQSQTEAEKKAGVDPVKKEKGKGWEKFKDVVGAATGLLSAASSLKNAKGGDTPKDDEKGDDDKKILGMSEPLFYGLVVVVVLVIVIAVVNAMPKKGAA